MKTCFKCHRELPRTEFYPHPQMADGLLGKCKDCSRTDTKQYYADNLERVREINRQRSKAPESIRRRMVVCAEWIARYPDRRKAQNALNNAVRDRRIQKPLTCQRCGDGSRRVEAHHHDYSQPFIVEWLCKPCHYKADHERRQSA